MSADTQNGASGVGDTRRAVAPAWKTLGVGAVSGFTSCVLLQPIDFLKTRLQQEKSTQTQMSRTNRLLASVRSVVAQHGWTGLWRGTLPTVVRNVPGVAAYFYTVNEIRWLVAAGQVPWLSVPPLKQGTSTLARLSPMGNLLTGAVARVGIGFILNPITIVKARFESSHYAHDSYPTISKSLRSIYRESGPSGFFRGFSATALRDAPYTGLYLVVYERSKVALSELSARVQSVPSLREATGNLHVVSASSSYLLTRCYCCYNCDTPHTSIRHYQDAHADHSERDAA